MKFERKFLKCDLCGNVVGVLDDAGHSLSCCGQEMRVLNANTTDAATEKHVPVVKREGNTITVTVGEVPHPMTEEHYISWINVAQGDKTQKVALARTGAPTATFTIEEGGATVYEYCNLHGLWAVDI